MTGVCLLGRESCSNSPMATEWFLSGLAGHVLDLITKRMARVGSICLNR